LSISFRKSFKPTGLLSEASLRYGQRVLVEQNTPPGAHQIGLMPVAMAMQAREAVGYLAVQIEQIGLTAWSTTP
jgi:hypothetical protein